MADTAPPPAPGQTATAAGPQMTMEELLKRERDMAVRTAELAKRDREVRLALQKMGPNWPKCCCCNPIVYHSIASEVPVDRVSFVTTSYYMYYFTIVLLVYNFVCALMTFITKDKKDASKDEKDQPWMEHMIAAGVHTIGSFLAFFVWHFPVYQATSTFERGKYKMAFLGLTVALIYDIFMAIGFTGYGGAGFLFMLNSRSKENTTPFYMIMVCAILWTLQACFFIWVIFFKMMRYSKIDKNRSLKDKAKAAVQVAGAIAGVI